MEVSPLVLEVVAHNSVGVALLSFSPAPGLMAAVGTESGRCRILADIRPGLMGFTSDPRARATCVKKRTSIIDRRSLGVTATVLVI